MEVFSYRYLMHPFVNINRKVIFWWTAKCGCTTVKSIMLESMAFDHCSGLMDVDEVSVRASLGRILYSRSGPDGTEIDNVVSKFLVRERIFSIHTHQAGSEFRVTQEFASQFRNILFVRDPLKRFVSGVLDKHIDGSFSHLFRPRDFLDAANNIGLLERHHFAPQTGGAYLPSLEYDGVFNIESIDYSFLSEVLGMSVEPRVMHRKIAFSGECPPNLAEAGYEELVSLKSGGTVPSYECFYNDHSRSLVEKHYRDDFELMRRWLPSAS